MEQSATVKTLHHTELMLKAAYIARADYHSDYDDRNYCWSKHDDSDLLYTNVVLAKGMPDGFKDPEKLINAFETDYVCRYKTTSLARDHVFSLSNSFVEKDSNGHIDKQATERNIRNELDNFFKHEFGDNGYAVYYAVHYGQEGKDHKADNLHVHAIVLANQYDGENTKWLSKSFKNEQGKYVYRNPLDDKRTSGKTLKRIRDDFASWQNKRLTELGKVPDVESRSFSERNMKFMRTYHLKRYHYEELEKLKAEYSYISDIAERNEKIIADRPGKLTKKQIHNLRAEAYNWLISQGRTEDIDMIKLKDEAMNKAFENKRSGFRRVTSASNMHIGRSVSKAGGLIRSAVKLVKEQQKQEENVEGRRR